MQKLLEIKGQDWMQGLSVQTGMALGGLFQTATGFDPFERIGFLQPALSATELTAPATNPIKVITPYQASGTSYVYAHSATKLYRYLRDTPFTQADQTASINVSAAVAGALIWKSKYIYAQPTDLRSWDFGATDVQILNGANGSLDIRKLCIGADGNLYIADISEIAKCVINTGTGGGNALSTFLIDSGFSTRDLVNDGRYLVIFADNNNATTTLRTAGVFNCRAYFWDMARTTADVIWDFPGESYLIGAAYLNGEIIVFGYNGIWICNLTTQPRMIFNFLNNSSITKRPTNPYQITTSPTSVYWGDGAASGQNIYAYGSLAGSSKKIFYSPYTTHTSTYAHTSLSYSAGQLFTGVDSPKFYVHNVGSTRGNATLTNTPIPLTPARYGYAKVVLKDKLSSGQSVAFSAATSGGLVVSDTETKTYSASHPYKSLKFDLKPATNSESIIEDLAITINPQGGAVVERVTVYGEPLSDSQQL